MSKKCPIIGVSILAGEAFLASPAFSYLSEGPKKANLIHELFSSNDQGGEVMGDTIIVTTLNVRTKLGKLFKRVEAEGWSLVIQKRGTPRAVLLSVRDYLRLSVPEQEVLRIIGQESRQKRKDKLSSQRIDRIIKAAHAARADDSFKTCNRHYCPCFYGNQARWTSANGGLACAYQAGLMIHLERHPLGVLNRSGAT